MNIEEIRQLIDAKPFNPIRVRVSDTLAFEVTQPQHIAINPFTGTVYVFTPEAVYRLTPEQILFTASKE